ncbi:COG1078 HD superfamily phosphohydrolases [Spirosomataceae bacterium]
MFIKYNSGQNFQKQILTNKRKIFNDPIYGFITIPSDFIFEIVQHPYFQRLRRIKQLGMAELVYPGAFHSRFQHALGAMHLMNEALNTLQSKGLMIMEVEREAALVAILLHDIGHGPFSHVLEYAILKNVNHEAISELLMEDLNRQFEGKLTLAIEMFRGTYNRSFFHQLISSQLDMDRMDYLNRDSFYTGVVEGNIGAERIIKMLHVVDNQLVVEEKGLLSVENFLVARRLMYWQVYLHKTSICSETMVLKIFERVKDLLLEGVSVEIPTHLSVFFERNIKKEDFKSDPELLQHFVSLDDVDIWYALKSWQGHQDGVLANLSKNIIKRNLFKIKIDVGLKTEEILSEISRNLIEKNVPKELLKYFFKVSQISNSGYASQQANIKILMKNGNILDVSEASDLPTIKAMSNIVKKNYICYANDVYLPTI